VRCEIEFIIMPVLPLSFYSNYYLVEISNLPNYFASIGASYNPTLPNTIRFLASKFEFHNDNEAAKTPLIQGKPGTIVQDVKTPVYTYQIEAPMIISADTGITNFLPYNSLNYFALRLANWQWQQLHGYNLTSTSVDILLENYTINFSESVTNQTLTLKSNYLLGDNSNNTSGLRIEAFPISTLINRGDFDGGGYNDISNFVGRILRNYDLFVNMLIDNTYYLTNSSIFVKDSSFTIKFMIENKYFLNQQNEVVFFIKNYDLTQTYGIVGTESLTFTNNFLPGIYSENLTKNTVSIGNKILFEYQAPMIIKKREDVLGQGNLVETKFDFSMYGANYAPTSDYNPYNNDLFYSDIA